MLLVYDQPMYDTFSSDYDRFVSWPGRLAMELPFIEQTITAALPAAAALPAPAGSARVLDAACGTGMHVIALAQRGYNAVGTDLSAGMIERARENARAAGVQTPFITAGFGELANALQTDAAPFDALLCLGNSLPHLLTPADLACALEDFADCLRPGGRLLIQNRNFDAVLQQRERWMEPQAQRSAEGEWLFLRFYDFEPSGLINFNIITLKRQEDGPWQQSVISTPLYPLRQDELVQALAQAGFDEITSYGGLNGSPFDPASSGNLVISARHK